MKPPVVKLPAPALACGCAACRARLHSQFASLISANYDTDALLEVMELSRIGFGRQTVGERILAYTRKEY